MKIHREFILALAIFLITCSFCEGETMILSDRLGKDPWLKNAYLQEVKDSKKKFDSLRIVTLTRILSTEIGVLKELDLGEISSLYFDTACEDLGEEFEDCGLDKFRKIKFLSIGLGVTSESIKFFPKSESVEELEIRYPDKDLILNFEFLNKKYPNLKLLIIPTYAEVKFVGITGKELSILVSDNYIFNVK
jgi:hypothetical protein